MANIRFLLFVVLLVGAAQINSGDPHFRMALPKFTDVGRVDIKGRLLTPEEGCGYSAATHDRQFGRVTAKNGAWPWVALLGQGNLRLRNLLFKCVGTLITSRHVLTAAHCGDHSLNFVRLGEFDIDTILDGRHVDVGIARIQQHEKWNGDLMINDIAVVLLERDVDFNDRIYPSCLPTSERAQKMRYAGANPFVIGWDDELGLKTKNRQMQQLQLPIVSNTDCKQRYKRVGRLKDSIQFSDVVLCAGYMSGLKDKYKFFAGGPLMLPIHENGRFPFFVIGINSYWHDSWRQNTPNVFTNVRHYTDWIQQKLN